MQRIEEEKLSRRKVSFKTVSSSGMLDFPEMTEDGLKFFFTGSYQLHQVVPYLAEVMGADNNIRISYVRERKRLLHNPPLLIQYGSYPVKNLAKTYIDQMLSNSG